MTITTEELVRREVHYCVSALVHTLAQGYGQPFGAHSTDLSELCEQAMELAAPTDDWESAAEDADDLEEYRDEFGVRCWRNGDGDTMAGNAREACEWFDVDPYQREVFEHWIVSEWLADRLAEKGEKVDKDFSGLVIWARTTTGQAISSDGVIEEIHAELIARHAA